MDNILNPISTLEEEVGDVLKQEEDKVIEPQNTTPTEDILSTDTSDTELANSVFQRKQNYRQINESARQAANAFQNLNTEKSIERSKKEKEVYENSSPITQRFGDYTDIDINDPLYTYKMGIIGIDKSNQEFLSRLTGNTGYKSQQKIWDLINKFNVKQANTEEALEVKTREHTKGEYTATGIVEDGDTVVVNGDRFRVLNGAISFDAVDDPGTKNKEYQIQEVAKRLGKAAHEVTDDDIHRFKTWTNYVLVNALVNNGFSKYEAYRPEDAEKYQQYIDEHNKDLKFILRPIVDGHGNSQDVYGRKFVQILSADGNVNISDSMALNQMLNLNNYSDSNATYFIKQPYYAAILQGDLDKANQYKQAYGNLMWNYSKMPQTEVLGGFGWLKDSTVRALNGLADIGTMPIDTFKKLLYYATGDEEALEKIAQYNVDHPTTNFFGATNQGYALFRQAETQEIIDSINQGGIRNMIKGYFASAIQSPLDALFDSMPEMMLLGFSGVLGKSVQALSTSRLVGMTTTFTTAALTAGAMEAQAAENEYYIRNHKPMPFGLYAGTLIGSTAILGLEIPAAMSLLTNPFSYLVGKQGVKAVNTSFKGLMKQNLKDMTLGLINETTTEPIQNAFFAAMGAMNKTSDILDLPSYFAQQWTGTHLGERIYEAGTALGMSGILGANGFVQRTGLPYLGHGITLARNHFLGTPTSPLDTNIYGQQIDEGQILLYNKKIRDLTDDLTAQRDKVLTHFDPNASRDDVAFQNELDLLYKKAELVNKIVNSSADTLTADEATYLQRLYRENHAFYVAKAFEYAQKHGLDLNDTMTKLYDLYHPDEVGTADDAKKRDFITRKIGENLLGSMPKTQIEIRLAQVRNALKQNPNNEYLKALEQQLLDDYNAEEVELTFSDGEKVIVRKDKYQLFEQTYRSYNPEATQDDILNEIQKVFTMAAMNDDVLLNGMYHNSLSEITQRIDTAKDELILQKASLDGQINGINSKITDDPLTFEQIQQAYNSGQDAIDALIAKYAPYNTDKWNIATIVNTYAQCVKLSDSLRKDFHKFEVFTAIRMSKSSGIIDTIRTAIINGEKSKAEFVYNTSQGAKKFTIYMGQFKAGDLDNPAANHKGLQLIKMIFDENMEIAERYSKTIEDLKTTLPNVIKNLANKDANEYKTRIVSEWQELHDLQQQAKTGNKFTSAEAVISQVKTDLSVILLGAINKIQDERVKAVYQDMLTNDNVDWLAKAQQYTMKQIRSNYVTPDQFNFKQLYKSLDADLRKQVDEILEKAFEVLKAKTRKRTVDDINIKGYETTEQKEELLKTQPYLDRHTNHIYNLILQTNTVKKEKPKQPKQDTQTQQSTVSKEEVNKWFDDNVRDNIDSITTNDVAQTITMTAEDGTFRAVLSYISKGVQLLDEKGKVYNNIPCPFLDKKSDKYVPYEQLKAYLNAQDDTEQGANIDENQDVPFETTQEDVENAELTPQIIYKRLVNALIQDGKFVSAKALQNNKQAILQDLEKADLSNIDIKDYATKLAGKYVPEYYYYGYNQDGEKYPGFDINYGMNDKNGNQLGLKYNKLKEVNALIQLEKDPKVKKILQGLMFWASRTEYIKPDDPQSVVRAGYAYAILINGITKLKDRSELKGNKAFNLLQQTYQNQIQAYNSKGWFFAFVEYGKRLYFHYDGEINYTYNRDGKLYCGDRRAYLYNDPIDATYDKNDRFANSRRLVPVSYTYLQEKQDLSTYPDVIDCVHTREENAEETVEHKQTYDEYKALKAQHWQSGADQRGMVYWDEHPDEDTQTMPDGSVRTRPGSHPNEWNGHNLNDIPKEFMPTENSVVVGKGYSSNGSEYLITKDTNTGATYMQRVKFWDENTQGKDQGLEKKPMQIIMTENNETFYDVVTSYSSDSNILSTAWLKGDARLKVASDGTLSLYSKKTGKELKLPKEYFEWIKSTKVIKEDGTVVEDSNLYLASNKEKLPDSKTWRMNDYLAYQSNKFDSTGYDALNKLFSNYTDYVKMDVATPDVDAMVGKRNLGIQLDTTGLIKGWHPSSGLVYVEGKVDNTVKEDNELTSAQVEEAVNEAEDVVESANEEVVERVQMEQGTLLDTTTAQQTDPISRLKQNLSTNPTGVSLDFTAQSTISKAKNTTTSQDVELLCDILETVAQQLEQPNNVLGSIPRYWKNVSDDLKKRLQNVVARIQKYETTDERAKTIMDGFRKGVIICNTDMGKFQWKVATIPSQGEYKEGTIVTQADIQNDTTVDFNSDSGQTTQVVVNVDAVPLDDNKGSVTLAPVDADNNAIVEDPVINEEADTEAEQQPLKFGDKEVKPFTQEETGKWKSGFYAGIGTRNNYKALPTKIAKQITHITQQLEDAGLILRSGNAVGSDQAFESSLKDSNNADIYYASDISNGMYDSENAKALAEQIHPNPTALKRNKTGFELMARNSFQVLGTDLNTPVDFIVCYAPNESGGTAQALRIAEKLNIPIFNLADNDGFDNFNTWYAEYIKTKPQNAQVKRQTTNRLNVSTASTNSIGKDFSALNLKIDKKTTVEDAYQNGKLDDYGRKNNVIKKGKKYSNHLYAEYDNETPYSYFLLYLQGLKHYVENVKNGEENLKHVLNDFDGYVDPFDVGSYASQADVLQYIKKYFNTDQFIELLKNNSFIKDKDGKSNLPDEFALDKFKENYKNLFNKKYAEFNKNQKPQVKPQNIQDIQTTETTESESSSLKELTTNEQFEKTVEDLFTQVYAKKDNNVAILRVAREVTAVKENTDNYSKAGWTSILTNITASISAINEKLGKYLAKLIDDYTFIEKMMFSDYDGKDEYVVYHLKPEYSIDSFVNAYQGTTNFNCTAYKVSENVALLIKQNNKEDEADITLVLSGAKQISPVEVALGVASLNGYYEECRVLKTMLSQSTVQTTINNDDDLASLGFELDDKSQFTALLQKLHIENEYNQTVEQIKSKVESIKKNTVEVKTKTKGELTEEVNDFMKAWNETDEHSDAECLEAIHYLDKTHTALSAFKQNSKKLLSSIRDLCKRIASNVNNSLFTDFYENYREYRDRFDNGIKMKRIEKEDEIDDAQELHNKGKKTEQEKRRDDLDKRTKQGDILDEDALSFLSKTKFATEIAKEYLALDEDSKKGLNEATLVIRHLSKIKDLDSDTIWSEMSADQRQNVLNFIQQTIGFSLDNTIFNKSIQYAIQTSTGRTTNTRSLTNLGADASKAILEMFNNSPVLQLLYSFKETKTGIELTLRPEIAFALYTEALSNLVEYSSLTSGVQSDKKVAQFFGISENQLRASLERDTLADIAKKHGTLSYAAATVLGRNICQRLGLKFRNDDKQAVALQNRIEQGFGVITRKLIEGINNRQIDEYIKDSKNVKAIIDAFEGKNGTVIEDEDFDDNKEASFSKAQLANPDKNIGIDKMLWFLYENRGYYKNDKSRKILNSILTAMEKKHCFNMVKISWTNVKVLNVAYEKNAINAKPRSSECIKFNRMPDGKDKNLYKKRLEQLKQYYESEDTVKGYYTEKVKDVDKEVRDFAGTKISSVQKTALENLQSQDHYFDEIAYELFSDHMQTLFYLEGGKNEEIESTQTAQERLSNKNISLERVFAALSSAHDDLQGKAFYLKYHVMKNMRFNCVGILNPQGDKATRWLTHAGKMRQFNMESEQDIKFEKWALANAFDMVGKDSKVEECSKILDEIVKNEDKLNQFGEDLGTLSDAAIEEKYGLGMENRFQAIAAWAHLKRKNEAIKNGKTSFETSLRVEIDSTTSGYFLRFMTYLDNNLLLRFGDKVGLMTTVSKKISELTYGKSIDSYASMESFKKAINDIYRQIAVELVKNNKEKLYSSWEYVGKLTIGYNNPLFATEADFRSFVDTLPSAELLADGSWDVSSALRSLLKSVVMVFGYSAGEGTMEHNLSEAFIEEYTTQANDAMREFAKFVKDPDKPTLKEAKAFEEKLKQDPDNAMMLKHIEVGCKLLKAALVNRRATLTSNGYHQLQSATNLFFKNLREAKDNNILMYYRWYLVQTNLRDNTTGERIDILPSYFIVNKYQNKDGDWVEKSFEELMSKAYDLSVGKAVINAMKEFSHLSHDNMVLSTIATMLNTESQRRYDEAIEEYMKQKLPELEGAKNEQEENDIKAQYIANDMTFKDQKDAITEYEKKHGKVFYAISTPFSEIANNEENRTKVVDAEWISLNGDTGTDISEVYTVIGNDVTPSSYSGGHPENIGKGSNGYTTKQMGATGYIARQRKLKDIGLVPTATTVQSLDSAVMTLLINKCNELGIPLTSIHDAAVISCLDAEIVAELYNLYAYLVCSKMCVKANYINQALHLMAKKYPETFKKVLKGEQSKDFWHDSKENPTLFNSHLLTQLSYKNSSRLWFDPGDDREGLYSTGDPKRDADDQQNVMANLKISDFILLLLNERLEIDKNWEQFYKKATVYIRNMGGPSQAVKVESLDAIKREVDTQYGTLTNFINTDAKKRTDYDTDNVINNTLNDNTLGSLDKSINITSGWQEVLSKADSLNSKAIIDVLDRLPRSTQDDPVAIANFKAFLGQLDLSNMAGFRVQVAETTDITQGETDLANMTIQVAINNNDTSTVNPSPATVYMHEVLHALLDYAFTERNNNPEINSLLEKMRTIQEEAAKLIKPSDLCGKKASKEEKAIAQNIWNYVFNNKNSEDRGLKEFLSYAITDKAFIKILSKHKIPGNKLSLRDRIVQFMTTLFSLLTLQTTVSDLIRNNNMLNNNNLNSYAEQNYYTAMTNLVKDIQQANAEAGTHMKTYNRLIYGFYNCVNSIRNTGNKVLVPFTSALSDLVKVKPTDKPKASDVIAYLMLLPFSKNARRAWYQMISDVSTHYEYQDIRLLLDDFSSLDKTREVLDTYARKNRVVEAFYQQIKDTVMSALETSFGKELTQEEQSSLTKIFLNTDIQCLYNGNNYDDIERLVKDELYRKDTINSIQSHKINLDEFVTKSGKKYKLELSEKTNKRIAKGLEEISNKWAYVLYYGKGDSVIGTGDNIDSIGERILESFIPSIINENPQLPDWLLKDITVQKSLLEAIKNRLNKLTTIKALDITLEKNPSLMLNISKLSKRGIKTLLDEHQGYVNNVQGVHSKLERMKEQGKGYTATQYNQVIDYQIVPLSERAKMEYNGYVLVDNIHDKRNILTVSGTGLQTKQQLGIFIKKNSVINKRSNSAFSFIASKWSSKDIFSYLEDGMTLTEAVSDKIANKVDEMVRKGMLLEDQRDAIFERKTREEIKSKYYQAVLKYRDSEIQKAFGLVHSKSKQQAEQDILTTAFDGDSYNPLTRQEKEDKLKLSQNAFDIISKQVATQTAFNKGKTENVALVGLLQDFAKYNMDKVTHRDKQTGQKYVDLTERLMKELHLSKDVLMGGSTYYKGAVIEDIWVREDFVERLFGVQSLNLSQAKYKTGDKAGYSLYKPMVRGAFEILETILKVVGYKDKETIVMRKPAVLLGNIMSNISYNLLSEPNLKKVLEMNYANIQNTNNYIQAQREYVALEHQERLRTLTAEEAAKMQRLKNRMDNNPLKPLFESGMFTAIVEDVSLKDREAVQDYFDQFANSSFVKGTPKFMRVIFNQLYMRKGTPLFDAFYNINKYSDFVARATEYQIQMEKHKKEIALNPNKKQLIENDILHDVWNAFIDYDRPNGKIEQYLNDTGLLMFTKYAKGIQRVIYKQATQNPMGLMVHLAREMVLPFDVEDIYESNVFNKKWGYMVHNPIDNIVDIIIPPLFRIFGMI